MSKHRNRKPYRRIKIRPGESRHHRLAKSLGGTDDESNISIVTQQHHDCFHVLFSNYTVQTIANILNEKWIDPRYKLVVMER